MQKRCIYSTLILLLFSFDKSVASPQVDVRFLFTSKFNFRSDTTFVPKFEYQLAIPQFPPAPYVALYQSPPLATVPTQTPDTLTSTLIVPHIFENEGIEQYPGERAYKRQRKLSSRRLAGYGSATAGKPLSYSLGPDVRGSWEPTHTQILEASLADEDDRHYEKPRYRWGFPTADRLITTTRMAGTAPMIHTALGSTQ
ncbi:uncharacterized protein LOC111251819 isoform X2 [Varroa destructor]|uniref:Uncharacterized protein n=1 Tax=Varroa destructor TaxID=109461 RepID=A0A7M7KBS2_VARDE|nr:uncharacterized protein LOC111251819 isoform X2 [Varroa destructor]